jgi:hypothetical protein
MGFATAYDKGGENKAPRAYLIKIISSIILSIISTLTIAQATYYSDFISSARFSASEGDFLTASMNYDIAFIRFAGTDETHYEAARCNALSGRTEESIKQLWAAFHFGFIDIERLASDTAFTENTYYDYSRLISQYTDSVKFIESQFNLQYISLIDTMHQLDYGLRKVMGALEEAYDDNGDTSAIIKQLWRSMKITDSIASYNLSNWIQRYGFPGNRLVGPRANKAACLILIHAPISIKRAHAKAFRQSCEDGTSPWDYYALFWDHLIADTGSRKMKYGTTYVEMGNGDYIMEFEDPNCINLDRESVGLPPYDSYR